MNSTLFKWLNIVSTVLPASSPYAACVQIIDLANRPSNIDSPCSIPFKKVVIELNYIDQKLMNDRGFQQNFPNAEIRVGLPLSNEFFVELPNYIQQTGFPKSGSMAMYWGIKHAIHYKKNWILAVEAISTMPSGSYYYGNQHLGAMLNSIASYSINEHFNLSVMLGVSRVSEAVAEKGFYFNSINPDVALTYSPNQYISFYNEIYGQSSIGVTKGAGFNFDAGLQFLIFPNTLLNLSAGQQLYNYLGDFEHYINVGISVML